MILFKTKVTGSDTCGSCILNVMLLRSPSFKIPSELLGSDSPKFLWTVSFTWVKRNADSFGLPDILLLCPCRVDLISPLLVLVLLHHNKGCSRSNTGTEKSSCCVVIALCLILFFLFCLNYIYLLHNINYIHTYYQVTFFYPFKKHNINQTTALLSDSKELQKHKVRRAKLI